MSQQAAVIADKPVKGALTQVAQIPIYEPSADQILVKAVAFAANPTDWKHIVFNQGQPGFIAGSDAAGVVSKVGANVKGFKVGDVVSTFLHGNFFKERGAFTEYVIADPTTTVKYTNDFKKEALPVGTAPSGKIDTYEGAASITLSLVTAALSFFGNLNISGDSKGFLLIWGGATSAGILGIQLAKKSFKDLKVIVTASSKNADFLKSIGADFVVDYHDSDAIEQIQTITKGKIEYIWDTVANATTFQTAYRSSYDSPSVKIDSTLFLGEKDITKDDRKGSVEFAYPTLAYVANGDEVVLFGATSKADEATLKRYNEFWINELPKITPELIHSKLIVLEPGFASANKALDLLQDDKVSGEKVVFRN